MTVSRKLVSLKLWTERPEPWDREALLARKKKDPGTFRRRFEMHPARAGDMTFPHFPRAEVRTILGEAQRSGWPCAVGVDISSKSRPGKAVVAVKVEPATRTRFPVAVRFGAWSMPEFLDQIGEVVAMTRAATVRVEDNGVQDMLIDAIGDQKGRWPWWMLVERTTTTSGNKANPVHGLPGLDVEFANGAWSFPLLEYEGIHEAAEEGVAETRELVERRWWARLAREFRTHPVASSSDGVMATWFARQGIEDIFF